MSTVIQGVAASIDAQAIVSDTNQMLPTSRLVEGESQRCVIDEAGGEFLGIRMCSPFMSVGLTSRQKRSENRRFRIEDIEKERTAPSHHYRPKGTSSNNAHRTTG